MNSDLVGRYMMRMASDIEVLVAQRDSLAQENEQLKQEIAALKAPPGPKAVPDPEEKPEGGESA